MPEDFGSRTPWSRKPSLREKVVEAGVDFGQFLSLLERGRSDMEMAGELGVPEKTVQHLRNHFDRYGICSTVGQD